LLRKHRDAVAAKAFKHDGHPIKVNIDKNASNTSALNSINKDLPEGKKIIIRQEKYLNNIEGQDHRFIKKRTKPMLGFKSFILLKLLLLG